MLRKIEQAVEWVYGVSPKNKSRKVVGSEARACFCFVASMKDMYLQPVYFNGSNYDISEHLGINHCTASNCKKAFAALLQVKDEEATENFTLVIQRLNEKR